MRVDKSGASRASAAAGRTPRANATNGVFSPDSSGQAGHAGAVSGPRPLAAVDSLMALQEVPDAMTGRARAVKRGGNMLDVLDDIRLGVLSGVIPERKLSQLLKLVRSKRDAIEHPDLVDVLDEIELRAHVELAKYGRAA